MELRGGLKPIQHHSSRAELVGPNSISVRPFLIIITALTLQFAETTPSIARSFPEAAVIRKDIIELFRVPAGKTVRLKDYNPGWAQTEEMEELGKDALKERARQILDQNLADLAQAQDLLYADDRYCRPDRPPGDGRGRQGRHDQARHVRREPAGLPGLQLQEAVGRGTATTTSSGGTCGACPSGGGSGSSTGRTTRTSSS